MLKSVPRWIVAAVLFGLLAADAGAGSLHRPSDGARAALFRGAPDGPPGRVVARERLNVPAGDQARRPVVRTPRAADAPAGPVVYRVRDVARSGASAGRVLSYDVRTLRPAADGPVAGDDGFDGLIDRAAQSLEVDAALVKAVIAAESGFDPAAVSSAGAQGLMQLMPGTARELGVRRPFDPEENVHGGTRYLKQMLDRYGDERLALAAYNAGPALVERHGGLPPIAATEAYVRRVLDLREQYRVAQAE